MPRRLPGIPTAFPSLVTAAALGLLSVFPASAAAEDTPTTAAASVVSSSHADTRDTDTLVIHRNGGWCWFEDPRVFVDAGKGYLLAGTVKSPEGDIDLTVVDLATSESKVVTLDPGYQSDDHNSPAILKLRDGHYLAMWCAHGKGGSMKTNEDVSTIRWRLSERPHDPYSWGELRTWKGTRGVTYSNLFQLPDGTLLDFHRGHGFDPNYLLSKDNGRTFSYGGHLLRREGKNDPKNVSGRPYLRYAQDGSRIHLITTEDHPRNYDNSIWHAYIENGRLHHSDGREIGPVDTAGETAIQPDHLTRLFAGDPRNVAWTVDLELDKAGRPYAAFSVQKDDHDKPVDKKGQGESGWDLRYFYARWDGSRWDVHPLAFAGSRLFAEEADYSGLVALHPHNPDVVFISTNADPVTGKPLISAADNQRHYEIFQGRTTDRGATWKWTPVTSDSPHDNLRPIVPKWEGGPTALLWLRGSFPSFRNYRQEVVLRLLPAEK